MTRSYQCPAAGLIPTQFGKLGIPVRLQVSSVLRSGSGMREFNSVDRDLRPPCEGQCWVDG